MLHLMKRHYAVTATLSNGTRTNGTLCDPFLNETPADELTTTTKLLVTCRTCSELIASLIPTPMTTPQALYITPPEQGQWCHTHWTHAWRHIRQFYAPDATIQVATSATQQPIPMCSKCFLRLALRATS